MMRAGLCRAMVGQRLAQHDLPTAPPSSPGGTIHRPGAAIGGDDASALVDAEYGRALRPATDRAVVFARTNWLQSRQHALAGRQAGRPRGSAVMKIAGGPSPLSQTAGRWRRHRDRPVITTVMVSANEPDGGGETGRIGGSAGDVEAGHAARPCGRCSAWMFWIARRCTAHSAARSLGATACRAPLSSGPCRRPAAAVARGAPPGSAPLGRQLARGAACFAGAAASEPARRSSIAAACPAAPRGMAWFSASRATARSSVMSSIITPRGNWRPSCRAGHRTKRPLHRDQLFVPGCAPIVQLAILRAIRSTPRLVDRQHIVAVSVAVDRTMHTGPKRPMPASMFHSFDARRCPRQRQRPSADRGQSDRRPCRAAATCA